MRILVVDDHPANRQLLRAQMEGEGYRVFDAENGVEALRILEREPIDAIISDILMPTMDGYRFCHEVRRTERFRDTPFVFYTNTYLSPSDEKLALDLGADKYLRKPASTVALLSALRETMAAPQRRRQVTPMAEADVLKGYSERLVRKLEEKNVELEQTKGELQQACEELRRTQQAAMQQERLHALGQMASGIVHDINNAISPVALYIDALLEREPSLSERGREHLSTIQRAIEDVSQTVARLREFYRPREPQLTLMPVALNCLTEQTIDLTRARWCDLSQRRGIDVRMQAQLAPGLPDILGAQHEIRDALTNLIFNAVDAMPEGGTLTLRTTTRDAPAGEDRAVRQVCLEVSDTGVGMDSETRQRCLEPFFTTKGERGTGLGLAMVFGMAQRHNAELEIDSAVGKGTTVRLTFAEPKRGDG